jgi:hypothetical protein
MAKKRRKRKTVTPPPLGPPTNVRPAGAHKDKRKKTRAEEAREALEAAGPDELT